MKLLVTLPTSGLQPCSQQAWHAACSRAPPRAAHNIGLAHSGRRMCDATGTCAVREYEDR